MKPACSSLAQSRVTYDTLKEVREVEKKILPLESLLKALDRMIDELQEFYQISVAGEKSSNIAFATIQEALKAMRREVSSYKLQAMYMHKRTQLTAQTVLDSLNLGYQQLAQNQSKNTFVMAQSAREDSVAIRAITLVTSLYLPFSFVAVGLYFSKACHSLIR
jgi:Mg2+ and Co2+ transporter CorA